jgi:exonuclease III
LSARKRLDSQFVNLITKHDIIILTETWTGKTSNIDLEGYYCYNFYRKFRHRNAKRNSGGIVIYVRNEIKGGLSIVKNWHDTIVWIKLDRDFFGTVEDIYIAGVYMWSDVSPISNIIDDDLFERLQNDIFLFESKGTVLVTGDCNARTACKSDYILYDRFVPEIDEDNYCKDTPIQRFSKDSVSNAQGNKLLDLCKGTSLRIANGRLGSDCGIGKFTCYNRNGSSVIDYLLLREINFNIIDDFKIHDFNTFSDHAPISFEINNSILQKDNYISQTEYIKWRDEEKETFRAGLISNLLNFDNLLDGAGNDQASINSMVNSFTNIIRNVADPLFRRTVYKGHQFVNSSKDDSSKWFDIDCKAAKNTYKNALHQFNRTHNEENRIELCRCKKRYKKIIKRKCRFYKFKLTKDFENLKKCKPREFWRYFKNKQSKSANNIPLNEFKTYFEDMYTDVSTNIHTNASIFNDSYDYDNDRPVYSELDDQISYTEVRNAIKRLNKHKAAGEDQLLNEYFIEACDILSGYITVLFNKILNTGHFPVAWTKGIIIPLYKKGDKDDVTNYRGITLLSNLGKLFTAVLNERINKWSDNNNIVSDAQFGFRKGRSTIDAVFVLNTLIQKFINENKRLYCCFIDMKRCFDSICRKSLWYKLYNMGLNGKILRIIRSMYQSVKSCIRSCDNTSYSDFFDIAMGLRQGEIISPIMFSLFVEDLELYLQDRLNCGLTLNELCIILLLFADDIVILATNPSDLQLSLDKLFEYCDTWGLEVNVDKSKCMVFRKRGCLRNREVWFYGENSCILENVNDFNYLGVTFNYTGNFSLNTQYLYGKGLKAMSTLIANLKKHDTMPKVALQLFDSFVKSTINYGCEIWGFAKSKQLETLHLKFCKTLLGVRQSSCNAAVYGELGRYPLYINRYVQIIKYWLKLCHNENVIINAIVESDLNDCLNGKPNWFTNVKTLLSKYGFLYKWNEVISTRGLNHAIDYGFLNVFKQRLKDEFTQEWRTSINNMEVLNLYKYVKDTLEIESYLNNITSRNLRTGVTRLRISAHSLRIQTGRYGRDRIDRNLRVCQICNGNEIEDEFHFVLKCPAYQNIRLKYIKIFYRTKPSMFKFTQLLSSKNKSNIVMLAKFIQESLEIRTHRLLQSNI